MRFICFVQGLQVYNPQSQKPGQKGKKRSIVQGYSIDSDTEIKYYFDYGLCKHYFILVWIVRYLHYAQAISSKRQAKDKNCNVHV